MGDVFNPNDWMIAYALKKQTKMKAKEAFWEHKRRRRLGEPTEYATPFAASGAAMIKSIAEQREAGLC